MKAKKFKNENGGREGEESVQTTTANVSVPANEATVATTTTTVYQVTTSYMQGQRIQGDYNRQYQQQQQQPNSNGVYNGFISMT